MNGFKVGDKVRLLRGGTEGIITDIKGYRTAWPIEVTLGGDPGWLLKPSEIEKIEP